MVKSENTTSENYRILVLAGKEDHMTRLSEACQEAGQETVCCKTIEDAFAFLETKNHVDVIVAEAFMENESVFDFLVSAKQSDLHKDVPVMIVASEPGDIGLFCMPNIAQTSAVLGAYKFIVLPLFDANHLVREIEAILPHDRKPKKKTLPFRRNRLIS